MNRFQVLDRPAPRNYEVAGRLLFVETFDSRLDTLVERVFAGWQVTPVPSPEQNPDIQISFTCGAELPAVPAGLSQFEVAAGGRCYAANDRYYLEFDNSLLHLAPGSPVKVTVWLKKLPGPSDLEWVDPELGRVTSFAVCAALRRFGMFDIHSAGVVVPDRDTGVLLVGPSGSGKTTLTLQLARALRRAARSRT
jgi:ABC-type multidrug transport system fused ATPase/permease subunit